VRHVNHHGRLLRPASDDTDATSDRRRGLCRLGRAPASASPASGGLAPEAQPVATGMSDTAGINQSTATNRPVTRAGRYARPPAPTEDVRVDLAVPGSQAPARLNSGDRLVAREHRRAS
jgi:hypothetical protein